MRYELSDYERAAIKPMLPSKSRGVRRVGPVWTSRFVIRRSGLAAVQQCPQIAESEVVPVCETGGYVGFADAEDDPP